MSPKISTVTIPAAHYRLLSDLAADRQGTVAARDWINGIKHPGDPMGTILCQAQRLGDRKMSEAMTAYMVAFRGEFEHLGTTPPTLAEVLKVLYLAVNTGRFPEADLAHMQQVLAREVPLMYGKSI